MNDKDFGEFGQLMSYVGMTITRIERLRYRFKGLTRDEGGDVQLWFEDVVLRLSAGPEGELLRIRDAAWKDPFSGPQTPENEAYLSSHGQWTLVDVSMERTFADLIGKQVSEVMPLTNRSGRITGVQMRAGECVFNVYVRADEVDVSLGADSIPLWREEVPIR